MFSGGAAYIMKHDTFSDSFAMHLLLLFAENYILATDVQWHTSNITQKQKYVNSVCHCEGVSNFSKTCQYATAIFSLSYWDVSIIVLFIIQVHLEFPTVWSGVLWQLVLRACSILHIPSPPHHWALWVQLSLGQTSLQSSVTLHLMDINCLPPDLFAVTRPWLWCHVCKVVWWPMAHRHSGKTSLKSYSGDQSHDFIPPMRFINYI